MAKPLLPDKIDKIVELRSKGLSYKTIGESFGVSQQAVQQALNNYRYRRLREADRAYKKYKNSLDEYLRFLASKD